MSNEIGTRQILDAVIVIVGTPISFSLVAGMYGDGRYDFMAKAFQSIGLSHVGFVVCVLIGAALFAMDTTFENRNGAFADELYGLLKDIGEAVRGGDSVEAAVQKSTGWRKTPVAAAFQQALELGKGAPFDAALEQVAAETGQPSFTESAMLVATAMRGTGDVGPALRWLAAHYSRMRQYEREFTARLNGALVTLRAIALVAAPLLYRGLEWSLAGHDGQAETTLSAPTVTFFTWGTLWMASLDGLVYGTWARVPAKIPLYIGLTRTFLMIW